MAEARKVTMSIGFDQPDDRLVAGPAYLSEVAGLLAELEDELDSRGTTSRDVLAVAFDAADGAVRVALRRPPLDAGYPQLSVVFAEISRACAQDQIGVSQLKRIFFLEKEVKLELVNASGEAEVYVFPIQPATTASPWVDV
jgi:hypothetical protein